jgi:NodT family efflux transporter outer membrane factor (OMF) lipoprotein
MRVGPDYEPPEPDVPDVWSQELAEGLEEGEADLQTWWTTLDDPVLNTLILRSTEGNRDLAMAAARVREAQARYGIATGGRWPNVDGYGSYQREQLSEDFASDPDNRVDDYYATGLEASWELDFWGRIARQIESADASFAASVETYRDVMVLLYAELAIEYINLRTQQERLRYAMANAEAQRQTLKLVEDRYRAGLVPSLDVRQAELNVATTESTIPIFRTSIAQAIHRMSILLGEPPGALRGELAAPLPIPVVPDTVLVGIPADVLRQRPDIRAAERELAAQTARIGVATAELYPAFRLPGSIGWEGIYESGTDLLTGGTLVWSLGAVFRWNIFDGGRVRNQVKVEDARTEQALAFYEKTVLEALGDFEDSIVAYAQERQRQEALVRSVEAAQASAELARTLYRTGLTDFQTVLDLERSRFRQEDSLAESEGLVTVNLVRIYRALGGGWGAPSDPEEEDAETEEPDEEPDEGEAGQ